MSRRDAISARVDALRARLAEHPDPHRAHEIMKAIRDLESELRGLPFVEAAHA